MARTAAAGRDLTSARAAFRTWMFDKALPFWAGPGQDQPDRGAHEHLQLDGAPGGAAYKRMRVQARQIYAFSHAALLGWPEGEALARRGYAFITRCGERPDGGWVRRLSPSGEEVVDPAVDLYDQAFVLFALAWYARATHEDEPLRRARRTLGFIRAHMALEPEGYGCVLPPEPGHRQQNPHMHLLEAALALYEASGEEVYLELAHELVGLFRRRLFDRKTATLGEYFGPDWSPAPGGDGDHVEPGHHFEWVWLLDQYERLTGADAGAEIEALYATALSCGTAPDTGLVFDAIGRDGRVRKRSIRLWPQTESLKAHLVMMRREGRPATAAAKVVGNLGGRFFRGCPAGAWIDQFDADGAPAVDKIPTSSFYHVFMAFAELERSAEAAQADSSSRLRRWMRSQASASASAAARSAAI